MCLNVVLKWLYLYVKKIIDFKLLKFGWIVIWFWSCIVYIYVYNWIFLVIREKVVFSLNVNLYKWVVWSIF